MIVLDISVIVIEYSDWDYDSWYAHHIMAMNRHMKV